MNPAADSASAPSASPAASQRRGFLARLGTIAIAGLVAVFPFAAGWGVLFHPLRRRARVARDGEIDGDAALVRICPLDALAADGVPRAFVVTDRAVDAWTTTPAERVGMVFLKRSDSDGKPQVTALSATCPHLGCAVDYNTAESEFDCPCHESAFAKDGEKLFGPSLRGLDRLEVKLAEKNGQTDVLVAFQSFRTGVAERVPIG
jgi:menaquinol-cytochrome c reductase iron-sulfur subunit